MVSWQSTELSGILLLEEQIVNGLTDVKRARGKNPSLVTVHCLNVRLTRTFRWFCVEEMTSDCIVVRGDNEVYGWRST